MVGSYARSRCLPDLVQLEVLVRLSSVEQILQLGALQTEGYLVSKVGSVAVTESNIGAVTLVVSHSHVVMLAMSWSHEVTAAMTQ